MFSVKVITTEEDLEQAYTIRKEVFVIEQNVPVEEEIDQHEETAIHFLLLHNNKAIGTSRIRSLDTYAKIERVCILKEERKNGAGAFLMNEIHSYCVKNDYKAAKLNAQIQAEPFYTKLGYQTISEQFLDAGIPHVTMTKNLS